MQNKKYDYLCCKKILTAETVSRVRFSEVDSVGIVWHGNFVKYLEDGREAWGEKYGFSYNDMYKNGFVAPIVKVDIDYKHMLKHNDKFRIETIYENSLAAKMIFRYKLYKISDNVLVAKATTVQVFMNLNRELLLQVPDFVINWKKEHNLL